MKLNGSKDPAAENGRKEKALLQGRDGAYLDSVGSYNPIAKTHGIEIDEEKVLMWMGRGAQLSEGARSILNKAGMLKKWEAQEGGQGAGGAEESAREVAETQE